MARLFSSTITLLAYVAGYVLFAGSTSYSQAWLIQADDNMDVEMDVDFIVDGLTNIRNTMLNTDNEAFPRNSSWECVKELINVAGLAPKGKFVNFMRETRISPGQRTTGKNVKVESPGRKALYLSPGGQGRSQPHHPGWVKNPLSLFFLKF